jgi:hypothetical protein
MAGVAGTVPDLPDFRRNVSRPADHTLYDWRNGAFRKTRRYNAR